MTTPILTTKLYIPPPRVDLIPRPRLTERLNEGLGQNNGFGRKLTLVSAPAGFGKSTLVSDWVRSQESAVAWLSLDEEDNKPSRFLLHFIAALQTVDANIGKQISPSLTDQLQVTMKHLIAALINDLTDYREQLILILDDYHVLNEPPIDRALSYFVENLPTHVHLIICSRIEPTMPLSRLRVRNELTEIRASDLRFTTAEVQQFFATATDITLDATHTELIEKRTEGWVAGLQLAALALKQTTEIDEFVHSFSGSHRYVMDYLTDEVLNQLGDDETLFLLQTSILVELSADLCNAVTQREDSQHILKQFESINLFLIPLDDQRNWYRYHHLFADLLQQRLAQQPQSERNRLHQRAAQWYEEKQRFDEAISHYHLADDSEKIVRIIKTYGTQKIMAGHIDSTRKWLRTVPDDMLKKDYDIAVSVAWMHFFSNQPHEAKTWLDLAEQNIDESLFPSLDEYRVAYSTMFSLGTWIIHQLGHPQEAVENALALLENLPEQAHTARGANVSFLAHALVDLNRLNEALTRYEESIAYHTHHHNWVAVAWDVRSAAEIYMRRGQLAQARQLLEANLQRNKRQELAKSVIQLSITRLKIAYEQNERSSMANELDHIWQLIRYESTRLTIPYHLIAACMYIAYDDQPQAISALEICEQDIQTWDVSQEKRRFEAHIMRLYLRLEDFTKPNAWLHSLKISKFVTSKPHEDICLAIIDILRSQNTRESRQTALEWVAIAQELCDEIGTEGTRLDLLCLQALLLMNEGETAQAMLAIEQALKRGEPEGYVRTFVDYGQDMAAVLRKAARCNIYPEYCQLLLQSSRETTEISRLESAQAQLIETLTEREIEVLSLMSNGATNAEIANRLVISVATVKKHGTNIYGKLAVRNRTKAVNRARELGFLE